jgi:hypothetical protein
MSSLLVFLFGVVKQFCRVLNLVRNRVLNSCRIWSTTQLNIPLPHQPHTARKYILYVYFGKGGGMVEVRGEGREATVYKRGRKYQHD